MSIDPPQINCLCKGDFTENDPTQVPIEQFITVIAFRPTAFLGVDHDLRLPLDASFGAGPRLVGRPGPVLADCRARSRPNLFR